MGKAFRFTLLLVAFGIHFAFAKDKLDAIKSNNKMIGELKDVYRAYKINHIISDQKEIINLVLDDSQDELKATLTNYLLADKKLNTDNITDKKLKVYVDSFLQLTKQNYNILKTKGIDSKEFGNDYKKYTAMHGRYMCYLTTHFAVGHFIKLTEDDYWKTINKQNYIKSEQYKQFQKSQKTDVLESRKLLLNIIEGTNDFQEMVIYKLALADQYVKYDTVSDTPKEVAISLYKSILNKKTYSMYVYETWLKWRIVTQEENGLSKSSEIPNNEYDSEREEQEGVILNYIVKNLNDEMAINQFLVLASHDIVRRFGDYPYGNQNTVEYHETFDDPK